MDDLKHLARTLDAILDGWTFYKDVKYSPRSGNHYGTPLDLERALITAHKIINDQGITMAPETVERIDIHAWNKSVKLRAVS